MKEHCLKALWLCRCVQACLMLGCVVPQVGGGVRVLGGVEISLAGAGSALYIRPDTRQRH